MAEKTMTDLLLEAIRYEHWLRYYFLTFPGDTGELDEADIVAVLCVPELWEISSRQAESHLAPLLDMLQGREISLDVTRDCVFRHVALSMEQDPTDPVFGERLFQFIGDPDFRRGLDAFHGWVQALANGECAKPAGQSQSDGPVSFSEWQAAFKVWEAEKAVHHITPISPYSRGASC
jgi:hypothetical protein